MANELLWLLFLIFDLLIVIVAFYLWGKYGLYAMIAASVIVCNIQVVLLVEMFGKVATLGNIVYASIFLSTDILSECYGKKEARRGVWIGFFCLFMATIAMQFAIHFKPFIPLDSEKDLMPHMIEIFRLMPRITLASLIAYLVSQHHDIWAFHFWRMKTEGRMLWLRNNLSTLVSQLIDSLIFTLIAFWGAVGSSDLLQIIATTYLFKLVVAGVDTPFIYLAGRIKNRQAN